MKVLVFSCLCLYFVNGALGLGYHVDVGIPEAARIRQKETRLRTSRIIGGMPSQYGENPHLAGLLITLTTGEMSVCSGTLLSSRKVLTAGQCWYDGYSQGKSIEVVLGTTQLFFGSRYGVSRISVHPGFDPRKLLNDLAMLTMMWDVNFYFHVKPAVLPTPADVNNTFDGVSARVSGFGKTSDLSTVGPNTVQYAVSVPVSANWYDCYYRLPQRTFNNDDLICTLGDNGWGTCGGDLGGPLVVEQFNPNGTYADPLLIGVTSIQSPFGCQTGFATGYVKVTAYLDWIQRNMQTNI